LTFPGYAFHPDEAILGPNLVFDSVPEPSTYALMVGGLFAVALVRRRKR